MLATGLLPAAATTIALASGTGTAEANTITREHTFTSEGGTQITCTISLTRTYPFGNDDQVGEGGTAILPAGAQCDTGVASISATYNDPDGYAVTTEENADGNATTRRYAPVGSNFVTIHRAIFSAGCLSNCEFTATRSK